MEQPHGLSILSTGLVFEYIDQAESDFLYEEIFVRNSYCIQNDKNFKHDIIGNIKLQDNDIVVDVGANIGLFSLFSQIQSKNIHVYAIEPLPPILHVLERNLFNFSRSHLGRESQSTFVIIPCGIINSSSNIARREPFFYFSTKPAESTRHLNERNTQQEILSKYIAENNDMQELFHDVDDSEATSVDFQSYECPVCSLEHIFEHYNIPRIDLLKIDVEGDELNALLSIGSSELSWRKINQIVVGKVLFALLCSLL
jgi:FkbM family methyltransferase